MPLLQAPISDRRRYYLGIYKENLYENVDKVLYSIEKKNDVSSGPSGRAFKCPHLPFLSFNAIIWAGGFVNLHLLSLPGDYNDEIF